MIIPQEEQSRISFSRNVESKAVSQLGDARKGIQKFGADEIKIYI